MKKIFKILAYVVATLVLLAIIGIAFVNFTYPRVKHAPDLAIEKTSDRVARGAYLANHVTVCVDCHSTRDFSLFSGPIVPGTLGQVGIYLIKVWDFPEYFMPKILPRPEFQLILTGNSIG